jgi:hypothetical protein
MQRARPVRPVRTVRSAAPPSAASRAPRSVVRQRSTAASTTAANPARHVAHRSTAGRSAATHPTTATTSPKGDHDRARRDTCGVGPNSHEPIRACAPIRALTKANALRGPAPVSAYRQRHQRIRKSGSRGTRTDAARPTTTIPGRRRRSRSQGRQASSRTAARRPPGTRGPCRGPLLACALRGGCRTNHFKNRAIDWAWDNGGQISGTASITGTGLQERAKLRLFLPPIRAQPFFAPLCDSLRDLHKPPRLTRDARKSGHENHPGS